MSKRVLILDDDRAQVPGLKGWFARFQHGYDYDVVAAATASETVTALTQGRPDLIIVEPETDGFDSLEIVSKLRQHDRRSRSLRRAGARTARLSMRSLSSGSSPTFPSPSTTFPSSTWSPWLAGRRSAMHWNPVLLTALGWALISAILAVAIYVAVTARARRTSRRRK